MFEQYTGSKVCASEPHPADTLMCAKPGPSKNNAAVLHRLSEQPAAYLEVAVPKHTFE